MLASLIHTHAAADAESGNWSAVAATLNAATVETRDATPLTYARIRALFGEPVRMALAAAVRSAAASHSDVTLRGELSDAHAVLLQESGGLRIDIPERQALLVSLAQAAGLPADTVTALGGLGIRHESRASQAGLGIVTADQCQQAWQAEQLRARLINAAALATERIVATDSEEQQAAKWATAWAEAV